MRQGLRRVGANPTYVLLFLFIMREPKFAVGQQVFIVDSSNEQCDFSIVVQPLTIEKINFFENQEYLYIGKRTGTQREASGFEGKIHSTINEAIFAVYDAGDEVIAKIHHQIKDLVMSLKRKYGR